MTGPKGGSKGRKTGRKTGGGRRTASPGSLVAQLSGDRPIALLPVRLETMFAEQNTVLKIRVFPDAFHVHTFEPELTIPELEAGRQYWEMRWGQEDTGPAWQALLTRYRPPRAAWIAEQMTPTNLARQSDGVAPRLPDPPTRDSPWTRPPRATALPDRWLAFGYNDGEQLFLKMGEAIPVELPVGITPDESADSDVDTQHFPDPDQHELPIDDGMRWMVDYDAALDVGMAITVGPDDVTPGRSLNKGLDRLIVVGVRGGDPTDDLADLLDHHRYTEGLELLRLGTPTNNTATVTSAFDPNRPELADSLDPGAEAPTVSENAGGRRLAEALGLSKDRLDRVSGAERTEDTNAAHMNRVLWATTMGYFLDTFLDPLVTDDHAEVVKQHFIDHVRGRGPLPPVRIGDQPYGVLPVVARHRYVPPADEPVMTGLNFVLARARGLWDRAATDRAPRLGRQGAAPDLLDVLESTPYSVSMRIRNVFGPLMTANAQGFEGLSAAQEAMGRMVAAMAAPGTDLPYVARVTQRPRHRVVDIPFVQEDEPLSEHDPLVVNYLEAIAAQLKVVGGFGALRTSAHQTRTLLDVLVRHAAVLEILRATRQLVVRHEVDSGQKDRPTKILAREPELVGGDDKSADTLLEAAQKAYRPVSGTRPLVDHVLDTSILDRDVDLESLKWFIDSVEHLAGVPSAELERLTGEELDLCSFRLDAWQTSLATRHLAELRAAEPTGVHLGGFGWVENLAPDQGTDSLGYVHSPSMAQAATTAVLRSGHLTHRHRDSETLAIDLSSDRVRKALAVLDGVRAGQPLGALLGYRYERAIRERNSALSQYVLALRRLAPLAQSTGGDQSQPLEGIAARDVCDGLKLLEVWRTQGELMFITGRNGLPPVGPHKDLMITELRRLEDLVDAVSDVLLSEAVHQSLRGNSDRAAAAMDALDRQGPPPDPEFLRTPRTGTGVTHRVLVALSETSLPSNWSPAPVDARAAADPRLNAWVARLLGARSRFRFALDAITVDADGNDVVVQTVECRLTDLGLSPLSVIWAAATGGTGQPTELEERIVHHLSGLVSNPEAIDHLELHSGVRAGWPDSAVGLADLLAMADPIRTLITGHRAAIPTDFTLAVETLDPVIDETELQQRAAAAEATLAAVAADLDAVLAAADPDPATMMAALFAAADIGVSGAVPGDLGTTDQVAEIRHQVQVRQDAAGRAETLPDVFAAVFGGGFTVLPLFTPPPAAAADLAASAADRSGLFDGQPLAATSWLQRMALVRPDVAALSTVLSNSELMGGGLDPTDLTVAQRPHRPGDRWLALELDGTTLPAAEVGLVIHAPAGFDPGQPQAALLVDEWAELIPNPVETTGVSFHYDAPGSRAAQAVVLAVPPELGAESWNLEWLLDTVHEALDLTKIRAVDPQRIWFANRFLPALYLASNARDQAAQVNLYQVDERARTARTARAAPTAPTGGEA